MNTSPAIQASSTTLIIPTGRVTPGTGDFQVPTSDLAGAPFTTAATTVGEARVTGATAAGTTAIPTGADMREVIMATGPSEAAPTRHPRAATPAGRLAATARGIDAPFVQRSILTASGALGFAFPRSAPTFRP